MSPKNRDLSCDTLSHHVIQKPGQLSLLVLQGTQLFSGTDYFSKFFGWPTKSGLPRKGSRSLNNCGILLDGFAGEAIKLMNWYVSQKTGTRKAIKLINSYVSPQKTGPFLCHPLSPRHSKKPGPFLLVLQGSHSPAGAQLQQDMFRGIAAILAPAAGLLVSESFSKPRRA